MNAVPALDSYLLDLLSGDSASTPPNPPRDDAATAEDAVAVVDVSVAADVASAMNIVVAETNTDAATASLANTEATDPPFVYVDHVPAVAEVPTPYGSDVDNAAILAAESADAPVGRALAPTNGASETNAPVLDTTADLLAEFDQEFPDQAVTAVAPTDTTADLLAEFDSEFPDQAVAASAAIDVAADLLAEFDSEFPDQAVEASAPIDATAALLAEFDAEFPAEGAAAVAAPTGCDFAAAVAEETEADEIQSRMPSAPIRVDAPAAPAAAPRNLVPPAASLPAYAKPVFDLLHKQAQDQAAQSPHGSDRRRASDRASRWLRMRCDDQHYALELLKVQEVVLPATLLPLRGAARHMLGVMNLRGQVVPVIDLGLYLDRAAIVDDTLTRIVVLEEQGEILGLRVSAVEDVTTLTEHQIEPPDNTRMCRITHPLFRGVARLNGQQTVILLDASELLR
jgi:purine-binding chemotaxis protein CheW